MPTVCSPETVDWQIVLFEREIKWPLIRRLLRQPLVTAGEYEKVQLSPNHLEEIKWPLIRRLLR